LPATLIAAKREHEEIDHQRIAGAKRLAAYVAPSLSAPLSRKIVVESETQRAFDGADAASDWSAKLKNASGAQGDRALR
jgi:hypothetical protein